MNLFIQRTVLTLSLFVLGALSQAHAGSILLNVSDAARGDVQLINNTDGTVFPLTPGDGINSSIFN